MRIVDRFSTTVYANIQKFTVHAYNVRNRNCFRIFLMQIAAFEAIGVPVARLPIEIPMLIKKALKIK